MSEQADKANQAIRRLVGNKVVDDAVAAAANFTVLPSGGDSGDGEGNSAKPHWTRLPTINWRKIEFAREVGQVMATEEMFQRDGVVVLIDPETGRLNGVTANKLITELERWFVFYKLAVTGEAPVKQPVSMDQKTASFLLEASEFVSRLRPIRRVNKVRMPVTRKDGRHALLPEGYDEESGIYTLRSGLKVDEAMPMEKAKAIFEHYLKEFPFEDERSKRVQICMMVALYGTCMLPLSTPRLGGLFRGNDRGTGKSLLAEMCIVGPFGLPASSNMRDRQKLAEVFDAAALQSEGYIFFDNLEGKIQNPMVDAFLTAKAWRVRLFHTQKTAEAVPGTMVFFTGNNLDVSPDIDRRTLICRLLLKEFDLQDRELSQVLNVDKLMEPAVRSELLGAMWALIRNWEENGCKPAYWPDGKRIYRVPGFEAWSDIFGGIVQAAGYGNPLERPAEALIAAPERVHQRRLVEMLANKVNILAGKKGHVVEKFQEIVDICFEEGLFPHKMEGTILHGKEGEADSFSPKPSTLSWLGLFMTNTVCGSPAGRDYTVPGERPQDPARRVRIGYDGHGRSRRWIVALLD